MPSVLHLCRRLVSPPDLPSIADIQVRHFAGDADIAPWLELRHQAFARQRIGVRQWSHSDFLDEFVHRWWWRPDHMWLADDLQLSPLGRGQVEDSPRRGEGVPAHRRLVGAVTLAMRGNPDDARPVIHWLMVLPSRRRRGIGRLLIAHLERAVWDAGHRTIWLETHAHWEAAAKFYDSLGYHPEHQ